MVVTLAPTLWIVLVFFLGILSDGYFKEIVLWVAPAVVTAIAIAWIVRLGWRAREPSRGQLCIWSLAASVVVVLTVLGGFEFRSFSRRTEEKVVLGDIRQLAAAVDQFALENPGRLYVGYDEIIGPECYIKAVNPIEHLDYHGLFPRSLGWPEKFAVRMPWGVVVEYDGSGGLPDASPAPLPPRDGVQVETRADRARLETTWRAGVRDGPARAYYPDGRLWSEATYVQGQIVGPCWLYAPDGTKLDELKTRGGPASK